MIITVSGSIASGKTTVAEAMAERFNLRHISAGRVFRAMAKERGLSLQEFSRWAEEDYSLDREVDCRQVELARGGKAIVDGRLSAHLIENASIRIWLKASLEERARRVAEREGMSYRVALEETREREASERKRYLAIYNIDIDNLEPYDIVLNTELWDAKSLVEIIGTMVTSSLAWMKQSEEV